MPGVLLLALMVFFLAFAMFGPASGKDHLYHENEAGVVAAAEAHWPYLKWCKHRTGWFLDHHMHYRDQFWKRVNGRLYHWHKEAYHHFGSPFDHDRRNTRCPLH
jgi:hypothetical protein